MPQLYYSPISINAGQVPSAQTDFPVLVSQTDARFKTTGNGGHVANANGYDIRPYSDSALSNALSYELERYNASTGEVIMWVKIASLTSSSTPIYLGYGDGTLSSDGSNGAAAFSNSFDGVYHLKDGSTLNTANSITGTTLTNTNGVTAAAGQIDGAGGFANSSTQYLTGTLVIGTGYTLSCWAKATSFPNAYNTTISDTSGGFADLFVKSTGKLALYTDVANYDGTGSTTLSTGTWYMLTMVYNSTVGLKGYVNATLDGTAGAAGPAGGGNTFSIGRDSNNAGRTWDGVIDEVRVSSVVRSVDWITTEYNNENAPGTFETLGTEVASSIVIERRTLGPRIGSRQRYVD